MECARLPGMLRTVAVLVCLAALLEGCVVVHPARRGTLSKRCMTFQSDADETVLENHFLDAREGSSGASGDRGGGCGCS